MIEVRGVGPGSHAGGCRNEETFGDFLPVKDVADAGALFISASGYGMACDELVDWLLKKRAWIDPYSNQAFTPEDIAAIRAWDRPEIARLQELEDAALVHLMLAEEARNGGDIAQEKQHRDLAAMLAPYHPGLSAPADVQVPLPKVFVPMAPVPEPVLRALPPPRARRGFFARFGGARRVR